MSNTTGAVGSFDTTIPGFTTVSNLDNTTSYTSMNTLIGSQTKQAQQMYQLPGYNPETNTMQDVMPVQEKKKKECGNKVCTPLIIFAIIVVIALIVGLFTGNTGNSKVLTVVITAIWYFIWGALIFFLCKKGKCSIAWAILLIPIIIWSIYIILLYLEYITHDF